jgi:chloramphenicol 3-O-phosphotransferase
MNPNQMNMAKAMVAQQALREEASRSRQARRSGRRPGKAREQHTRTESHGVFDYFLSLALPGRR